MFYICFKNIRLFEKTKETKSQIFNNYIDDLLKDFVEKCRNKQPSLFMNPNKVYDTITQICQKLTTPRCSINREELSIYTGLVNKHSDILYKHLHQQKSFQWIKKMIMLTTTKPLNYEEVVSHTSVCAQSVSPLIIQPLLVQINEYNKAIKRIFETSFEAFTLHTMLEKIACALLTAEAYCTLIQTMLEKKPNNNTINVKSSVIDLGVLTAAGGITGSVVGPLGTLAGAGIGASIGAVSSVLSMFSAQKVVNQGSRMINLILGNYMMMLSLDKAFDMLNQLQTSISYLNQKNEMKEEQTRMKEELSSLRSLIQQSLASNND